MNKSTDAWISAAPKMAEIMHFHSGYPNKETAENVIWLALLMAVGGCDLMSPDKQIQGGLTMLRRYYTASVKMGLIDDNPELYNPSKVIWTPQLLTKANTGYIQLYRAFQGPITTH
mgnify:CR=1 FL=1|tara:strand:+ start:1018 stop:1365 length:348 start_codon:yes stop_codon:yes gene_type:complete